jgi:hypothetical protein
MVKDSISLPVFEPETDLEAAEAHQMDLLGLAMTAQEREVDRARREHRETRGPAVDTDMSGEGEPRSSRVRPAADPSL